MIRGLFVLTLIILGLNGVYVFASPLVKNLMLEGKIQQVAPNHGRKSELALRTEIMTFAYDKGINLTEKDLLIRVVNGEAIIAAKYSVDVNYWKYSRHYEFFPVSGKKAALYWRHEQGRGRPIG